MNFIFSDSFIMRKKMLLIIYKDMWKAHNSLLFIDGICVCIQYKSP